MKAKFFRHSHLPVGFSLNTQWPAVAITLRAGLLTTLAEHQRSVPSGRVKVSLPTVDAGGSSRSPVYASPSPSPAGAPAGAPVPAALSAGVSAGVSAGLAARMRSGVQ